MLVATLVALAACSSTGVQPKRAPAKTCLDCHPKMMDKFKSGYVHEPVKEKKCGVCHRPHGVIGGLFQVEPQPGLCYQCHGDKRPAAQDKSVHKPVASGKCTVCHEPHNSAYKMLLKAGRDKICFTCHQRAAFARKYRHAPLEQGCGTCHDAHLSKNVALLKQAPDKLCRSCHQVGQETFKRAHFEYPVKNGCLLCHSPHSSDRQALLRKNVHAPVLKGRCDSCHTVRDGVISTKNTADKLCLTCHDFSSAGKKSTHPPFIQGKCTACHAVHASDYPFLLARAPEKVCLTCHEKGTRLKKPAGTGQKAGPQVVAASAGRQQKTVGPPLEKKKAIRSRHLPVSQGKCLDCHQGHVSDEKDLLKTAPDKLCFNCHDRAGYAAAGGSHPPAKGRQCETCHTPHESANQSLLRAPEAKLCFSCHRQTADERGMFSLHRPFVKGDCGGCHKMHKPVAADFLKAKNQGGALCLPCHKTLQEAAANNSFRHKPVADGQCQKCHAAHAADYAPVLKQAPGVLCLDCHENIKQAMDRATFDHRPAVNGDCVSCHSAHGSSRKYILKKGQPMLCLTCHADVAKYWRKGVPHQPAIKNCLLCHSPHGSREKGMLKKASGALCRQCHDSGSKAFLKAHHDIRPRPSSCVTCHDSHGGPDKGLLYPVIHAPFKAGTCRPCHPGRSK